MKKIFLLNFLLFALMADAQNLVPESFTFNPEVAMPAVSKNQFVSITLDLSTLPIPASNTNLIFTINKLTLTNSPVLTTSNFVITKAEWTNAVNNNAGKIQIPLNLQTKTYTTAPQFDEMGTISVSTDVAAADVCIIRFSSKALTVATSATVTLRTGFTNINPLYSKDANSKTDSIHVMLELNKEITNDTSVLFDINSLTLPDKPTLLNNPLKITKVRWDNLTNNGNKTAMLDTFLYIQTTAIPDTLKQDEIGQLIIHGKPDSFNVIRLTEKGMFNPNKPFWIETGTNFDLLDKLQFNNLYAGIYMFEKDIARIGSPQKKDSKEKITGTRSNNLSFTGGVYESKSSSFSTSSDSGLIYRDGTSYIPHHDTAGNTYYKYYHDTGTVSTTSEVQSIGIFFSPQFRLTQKPSNEYGFHVYFSAYLEMLWQRVRSHFDYTKSGRDSVFNVSTLDATYQHPFKENDLSSDYRSQYIGLGFPVYMNDNSFSLYINDAFGLANQRFVAVQDTGLVHKRTNPQVDALSKVGLITDYQNPKHAWNPFYLLQFRLSEEKYGIVFTGEVRGFFLRNSKPVISLALSKKFDLAELFHTIVKPFTPGNL